MKKKRLALLGCGYLNKIVADAVINGVLPEYELVGVLAKNSESAKMFAHQYGATACSTIDQLMDLKPDFVPEAAAGQAVVDYAETILSRSSNIIILSAAPLADTKFFEKLKITAEENDVKIYLPGGATGAYSLLQTASLMSKTPIEVTITSKKSPNFIKNTPFYKENLMGITKKERVFSGSAKDIIEAYPYVFNVIFSTANASAGLENTTFHIDATPDFSGDDYRIEVTGDDIQLDLSIMSQDYSIAGWSVVTILKNAVSTVVF
ncbi:aspartate dehydrogenase [Halolactibacillus halophilus]|uniref:Aspartate dehydrogenase n=1 Tax=Halolactibacillus halophilus TaxID=306540 RepID=A0A1I5R093_9BACI|nr:aspartate dehydrogenase domain-containing protein [Halolactibacillus halophilus]GEM01963.1 hypothetical protein HHA03_14950 [Halolactibacillus halophilus]SFP51915.1 aspartate dehydrogenase [Halolactibacillus halophilus]